MDRWTNKIAVVTGASCGIGKSIVEELVRNGLKVVGLARRPELVEEYSKNLINEPGKVYSAKCDVGNKEEVAKTFLWIKENIGPVQILVNNAGVLKNVSITEGSLDDLNATINTNLNGAIYCSKEVVNQLKASGLPGHIIMINSICGHTILNYSPPVFNVYPATKFGITALTEVLRQEFTHFKLNIKITSLSPGLVDTHIFEAGNFKEFTSDVLKSVPHLKVKDVSDAVIYLLGTPPHVQVQELLMKPLHSKD